MKQFKKFTLMFVMTALIVTLFAGCGKRGKCEECGQTEKLTEFVDSYGTTHWYCNDCYRMAKLFEF